MTLCPLPFLVMKRMREMTVASRSVASLLARSLARDYGSDTSLLAFLLIWQLVRLL